MDTHALDNGLGLGEFLAGTPEGGTPPSPDTTSESKGDESAPADADAEKSDDGSDDAATGDGTADAGTADSEKKDGDAKTTALPAWDADANPWKSKAEALEKQVKDTRDYATRVNQESVETKRALERLEKKVDGSWDEAAEKQAELDAAYEKGRDPANIAMQAKIGASVAAAMSLHGEETIKKILLDPGPDNEFDKLSGEEKRRVYASEAPAIEALKVIEWRAFSAKYGPTPKDILKNLRAEMEAEVEKLAEEKFKARIRGTEKAPSGLGGARGAGGNGADRGVKGAARAKTLDELFPHLS